MKEGKGNWERGSMGKWINDDIAFPCIHTQEKTLCETGHLTHQNKSNSKRGLTTSCGKPAHKAGAQKPQDQQWEL